MFKKYLLVLMSIVTLCFFSNTSTSFSNVTVNVTLTGYANFATTNAGKTPGMLIIFRSNSPHYDGTYDEAVAWHTISSDETNVAVDCGANGGYFTCVFNNNAAGQATSCSTSPIDFFTPTGNISSSGSFSVTITCTLPDITPPAFQSASTNATGSLVVMTYNDDMSCSTPDVNDYIVKVNNTPISVTNVNINNTDVELTVSPVVHLGETVTVSYDNSFSDLIDCSYNDCAALTDQPVTNNSTVVGGPADPTSFTATTSSTSQINLGWSLNGNNDAVVVAYNTTNTFGTPSGTYSAGNPITGGGTVLYAGTNTSYNHTSLSTNNHYYYKIWSKDGSNNYSSGLTDNKYTNSNIPSTPTLSNRTTTTIDVAINSNGNPSTTEYAIRVGANYVQANGSLGASAVWQTETGWEVNSGNTTKTITGLTAGTNYTVDVKARNGDNVETSFSSSSSLYTYSTEPTNHSNTFTSNAASPYEIDLTFQAGSGITNWSGYIILKKTGATAPDNTNITDGIAPNSLTLPVGTTLLATITNNGTTTYQDGGLNPQTQYSYELIPFNWNGVSATTYNYKTSAVIPTTTSTTLVAYPTTQSTNITFSNITRTSMTVKWTRGDGDNSILLGRERYSIPSSPLTDGITYTSNSSSYIDPLNSVVNGAIVLYNGNSANPSVNVSDMTRYKLYYFKVCEYNEPTPGDTYYLQDEGSGNPRSRWTLRREGVMENDLSIDAEFLYPNPAKDKITATIDMFEAGKVNINLYDGKGSITKQLYSNELPFGTNTLVLDLKDIPSGFYIITINKGNDAISYPVEIVK